MILTPFLSSAIVRIAEQYFDQPYDYTTFNCVHFVRSVYSQVGIEMPKLDPHGYPPREFHLSAEEFATTPIGHSVFLKRKSSLSDRWWTHVAIIISPTELIHCSRYFGSKVVITSRVDFMEVYSIVQPPLL